MQPQGDQFYKCRSCGNLFDEQGNRNPNPNVHEDDIYYYQPLDGSQFYYCPHCLSTKSQIPFQSKDCPSHTSKQKIQDDSDPNSEQDMPQKKKTIKKPSARPRKERKIPQQRSQLEKKKSKDRLFYSILNAVYQQILKFKTIILKKMFYQDEEETQFKLKGESMTRILYKTFAIISTGLINNQEFLLLIGHFFKITCQTRRNKQDGKYNKLSQEQKNRMFVMIQQFLPKISNIILGNYLEGVCLLFWGKSFAECQKLKQKKKQGKKLQQTREECKPFKFSNEQKRAICNIIHYFGGELRQISDLKKLVTIWRKGKTENQYKGKTEKDYIKMKCQDYQNTIKKRAKRRYLKQNQILVGQQVEQQQARQLEDAISKQEKQRDLKQWLFQQEMEEEPMGVSQQEADIDPLPSLQLKSSWSSDDLI